VRFVGILGIEFLQKTKMAGIKRGDEACSQRSYRRKNATRGRKKSSKLKRSWLETKKKAQNAWRCRIGRCGRAVQAAITVARNRWARHGVESWMAKMVKERTVYLRHACNDPQKFGEFFLLFSRTRAEREKDRRLGRFVAIPAIAVKKK